MSLNSQNACIPIILETESDSEWLVTNSGGLSRGLFLGIVADLAEQLPDQRYAINLCEDRRNFMAGFSAALIRGQTVLLPSNRSLGAVAEIAGQYPDCYVLSDGLKAPEHVAQVDCHDLPMGTAIRREVPLIDADHIAAIVFTSGSTGKAIANPKTWGSLVKGVELAQRRFGFNARSGIVATVPPQHMYGLETSVLVPLMTGARVFGVRPFFPEDIRQALQAMKHSAILVTTPIHLRACVASGLTWPELEGVISATAPLDVDLAVQAEAMFRAPLREIYGCTEAGSLASRRTTQDSAWTLYDEFQLHCRNEQAIVSAEHLDSQVTLSDVVKIVDETHFELLGRHSDMLNIAGKRASLSDLNLKLNAVPGVKDGVIFVPDQDEQGVTRLAALVVAPELNEKAILEYLVHELDPVFLPRPLYRVDALPRNETGKLPREALLEMLQQRGLHS